jgi:hypothetical protein
MVHLTVSMTPNFSDLCPWSLQNTAWPLLRTTDVSNLFPFQIDEMDMFAFCGTTTGDVVKIKLNYDSDVNVLDPVTNPILLGCFGKYVGRKKLLAGEVPARYSQGEFALLL